MIFPILFPKPKLHIYSKLITDKEHNNGAFKVVLNQGVYFFQIWGASSSNKSLGGYSEGFLTINNAVQIFARIGGKGNCLIDNIGPISGGQNGGGAAYLSQYQSICSGGGGTDLRFYKDSVYYRFIVAGGAGTSAINAFGGGLIGGTINNVNRGKGATQENPGFGCVNGAGCNKGTFGKGGDASIGDFGGGGGGGWFGGASGSSYASSWTAGGGGSGYVLTRASYKPDWYPLSKRKDLFLYRAKTIQGNESFPAIEDGMEVGHLGDGAVRIIFIHDRTTPRSFVFLVIILLCYEIVDRERVQRPNSNQNQSAVLQPQLWFYQQPMYYYYQPQ